MTLTQPFPVLVLGCIDVVQRGRIGFDSSFSGSSSSIDSAGAAACTGAAGAGSSIVPPPTRTSCSK